MSRKKLRLGNIAKTNLDSYSPKENWEFVNYLDTGNITQNNIHDIQKIDLNINKLPSRAKRKVKRNSIIYSTVRPNQQHYGIIKEPLENFLVSTGFTVIDVDEYVADPNYIFYYLTQFEVSEFLQAIGEQSVSAYPSIKPSDLENLEIELPCLKEQKKIVSILNSIDRKIKINSEINNNLAQQFTTLVDVIILNLPEYQIKNLSDVAECQNGHAFYKEGYDQEGAMVIDLGNVNTSATFVYTSMDKYISIDRYNDSKLEKYRVYKDDLIMVMTDRKSTMDILGKTGKVFQEGPYLLNQRMYRIRAKSNINVNYLYAILNSTEVNNALKEKALGSVQKYVNTGSINEIKIKLPSINVMKKISEMINPIMEQIENNTLENEVLYKLRDNLLPKLLSGEIDVSSIEL